MQLTNEETNLIGQKKALEDQISALKKIISENKNIENESNIYRKEN